MDSEILPPLRSAIIAAFPELVGSSFQLEMAGWDSTAVDVDDRLIFKFPRHAVAQAALLREAALLAVIRPGVTLPVPEMQIHAGPPLFSRHNKLHGAHLLAADYARLPEAARQLLGETLGQFYAQLHRLDQNQMRGAGAEMVSGWQGLEVIRHKALPALPGSLQAVAEQAIADFGQLPPDPYGTIYGHFDGHGWNMAFDHAGQRLVGLYDFADSGFGPLHQEFIYSSFIALDLTARIVDAYEIAAGRMLDRRRIHLLTGIHRLSELAELTDDPVHAELMLVNFAAWAER